MLRGLLAALGALWENIVGAAPSSPTTTQPVIPPKPVTPPKQTNRFAVKGSRLYYDNKTAPFVASPNKSSGALAPQFLLIHYTANGSMDGTVAHFKKPLSKVSAHLVMDRDGSVTQMLGFNEIGWHAGKSKVTSKWGKPYSNINNRAVGIEVVNYGYKASHVPASVDTKAWPSLVHFKETTPRQWQPYPDEQYAALVDVAAAICKAFDIPVEHIKGHDEVSLSGKTDPGPAFNMVLFRKQVAKRMEET